MTPPVIHAGLIAPVAITPTSPALAMLTLLYQALRPLPVGSLISGTVVGRDAKGQTLLATDAGQIALRPSTPLPQGSLITLEIQSTGATTQAVILSIKPNGAHGTPAQPASTPGAPAAATGPPAATSLGVAPAGVPAMIATVIASPEAPPTALPIGTLMNVRLSATQASGAGQVEGVVVARLSSGIVIDTSLGRLAIAWPSRAPEVPVGARLALEVASLPRGPMAQPTPGLERATPLGWPALGEAEQALGDDAERQVLREALPRPGPDLAARILRLLTDLASEARPPWLTAASESLDKAGRADLAGRLEAELRDPPRPPMSPDWRAVVIPFADGEILRQLRISSRAPRAHEHDERAGTRFLVECEHGELGAIQVDGLIHRPRLDVVVRSQGVVDDPDQDEIRRLFLDACGGIGYTGTIAFKSEAMFPLSPIDRPRVGVGLTV